MNVMIREGSQGFCSFVLLIVLWGNLASVGAVPEPPEVVSTSMNLFGLTQNWDMFVDGDYPSYKVYPVVEGRLANGRRVNLFQGGPLEEPVLRPPDRTFPDKIVASELYRNYRWRIFFVQLRKNTNPFLRPMYGRYLCRRWNRWFEGGKTLVNVRVLDITRRRGPDADSASLRAHPLLVMNCSRAESVQ
jgi:hypothetical protein